MHSLSLLVGNSYVLLDRVPAPRTPDKSFPDRPAAAPIAIWTWPRRFVDADPARSRLRRGRRAPILGALGLIVALVAVVTLVTVVPDKNGDDGGVAEPAPPPCAEPGTRELVEPGAGSVFGFLMPRCFRPADDAVDFTEAESSAVTLRTVIVPVEVVAEGEVIRALIIVSASEFSSDMSNVSDAALEAQLWRDVDPRRNGLRFTASARHRRRSGLAFHQRHPDQRVVDLGVRQAHIANSGDLPVDRSFPTGADHGRL